MEGKRSIPFSPDQGVGGLPREHTSAFFLHVSNLPERRGKSWPLQLEQVEIPVPIPKPVGGETRGEERKTLFSPQERKDGTETSLACRAEQYCSLSPSLAPGSRRSARGRAHAAARQPGPSLCPGSSASGAAGSRARRSHRPRPRAARRVSEGAPPPSRY